MDTSDKSPVYIDETPITSLVTITHNGIKYRYRQLIPEHWIVPMEDTVLDVIGDRIYTVAGIAYDISTRTLVKIVVVEEDGKTIRYLNVNEVRILHNIKTFNPALN